MKAKLSTLARRLEELEMQNQHEEHYPTVPSVRDLMAEHDNVVGQYNPPTNSQYSNTYNPN